jgi:putative tricarboxylic transport membrane protein
VFETYIVTALIGTMLGFLVGFLPGISITALLIVGYAFLLNQDLMTLMILYTCMLSAAQYSGSISALYLGIPGEANSLPLVTLRNNLLRSNSIGRTIVLTCIGSALISILALLVALISIEWLSNFDSYLRSWVLTTMGVIGILLSMIFSDNKVWLNLCLVIVGWTLGKVGTDPVTMQGFLTFGNDYLSGGIPTIAVLLGLFAVPCLANSVYSNVSKSDYTHQDTMRFNLHDTINHLSVIARSGIVGFVAGLIPYIGVAISSNLAYHLEKWCYPQDSIRQAVAAESANNAASISVLIPFITFGVAITSGEAVMLDIISQNNLVLSLSEVNLVLLTSMLVISNLICICLAWPMAKKFSKFYSLHRNKIMWIVVVLCVYTVIYIGAQLTQAWYYLLCLAVLSVIGYTARKIDTLPLIFAFLLQANLEPAILRSANILEHALQI